MEIKDFEMLLNKMVLRDFCHERHSQVEKEINTIKIEFKSLFEKLDKRYNKIMWIMISTLIAVCMTFLAIIFKKGG